MEDQKKCVACKLKEHCAMKSVTVFKVIPAPQNSSLYLYISMNEESTVFVDQSNLIHQWQMPFDNISCEYHTLF